MCCSAKRQRRAAAAAALAAQNAQVQQPNTEAMYGAPPSYAVANGQYVPQNNGQCMSHSNGCYGRGCQGQCMNNAYQRRGCCGSRRRQCGRGYGDRPRFSLWSLFSRREGQMNAPGRALDFENEVKGADEGSKGFGEMTKKVDDAASY